MPGPDRPRPFPALHSGQALFLAHRVCPWMVTTRFHLRLRKLQAVMRGFKMQEGNRLTMHEIYSAWYAKLI